MPLWATMLLFVECKKIQVVLIILNFLLGFQFAGTMVPQPCPNGTYTQANQGGLQEERECLPCPPGQFCR